MKKVIRFSTAFACLFSSLSYAQELNYSWSSGIGNSGQDQIQAIAASNNDLFYEAGTFEGTVNFNPNGTAVNESSLGLKNGFITKKQSDGTYLSSIFLLGQGTIQIKNLHLDRNNELYAVGSYNQSLSIDNGSIQNALPTVSVETGFVIKFDQSGNILWANALLTQSSSVVCAVKTTSSNDLVIVGKYADSTDFDFSTATHYMVSNPSFSAAYTDGFYATYTPNGNLIAANSFGDDYPDGIVDVAIDSTDNLILTGFYRGSIDCDPSISNAYLPFSNMDGIFLVKYSNAGNLIFSGGYPQASGSDHIARKVICDADGNVFICGDIAENIDLDFGPASYSVTGYSGRYVFYAKYSPSGTFLWGNSFGNSSTQTGNAMALDASNHLYIAGSYFAHMTIDDSFGNQSPTLVNAGTSDVFLVRYNADGELLWSKSFGGTQDDQATSIAISGDNLYMAGYFSNTINLDPQGIANNQVSQGSIDAFAVKYQGICSQNMLNVNVSDLEICAGQAVSITASGMDQYTFDNGVINGQNFNPNSSMSYTIVGENTTGAACIISKTVDIQVNTVNASTSLSGQTITASETGASYQWLNCTNNFAVINGQTGQSFTPGQTGNYAVIVTKNGCSDTSACTSVTVSSGSIDEQGLSSDIHLFPNPTTGNFTIILETESLKDLEIMNLSGQKVLQLNDISSTEIEISEQLPSGLYLIHVSNSSGKKVVLKLSVL